MALLKCDLEAAEAAATRVLSPSFGRVLDDNVATAKAVLAEVGVARKEASAVVQALRDDARRIWARHPEKHRAALAKGLSSVCTRP